MNAYFNISWNFHYFKQEQKVAAIPSTKRILKCNRFKLNPLIRKLLDHLTPKKPFPPFVLILNIFFPIHR